MWQPIMLTIIIFVAIVLVAGYWRLPRYVWIPVFAAWLVGSIYFQTINPFFALILLLVLIAASVFLFMPAIRREWVTGPSFDYFKKLLPPISQTEQEALDAGNLFWEADLMRGTPDWNKLFKVKDKELTDEESAFLSEQTETLCAMLNDWDILRAQDLPKKVWDYIRKERFWGLIIPKEYGGLGFSTIAHSQIVMKIATVNATAAVTVMVPNSLGPGELLIKYGTDAQKKQYLSRLAKGEEVPCFGLTEPMAGSDANGMEALGVVTKGQHEGKEVLGVRLNWDKRYITLAPIATLVGLAFKLTDPDGLLGKKQELGITLCLIPSKHPGVKVGERHIPLTMGFMNGPIHGRDVFIPLDWIIGGKERIGQGWKMLMECLAAGRGISLPAMGTACAKLSYRTTGAYANMREQFDLSIGRFPGVQESMGRIGGLTYLAEATRLFTAAGIDAGYHSAVSSSITKYYLTEFSRKIIDDAMDIHGGRGIIMGPRNYLATAYLANPIGITVEGANILTRTLMIFGQGAVRCHPFLVDELKAAANPNPQKGLDSFDELMVNHIGAFVSNIIRLRISEVRSWYHRHWGQKNIVKSYCIQLERMSNVLAVVTDLLFAMLGGNLKRDERVSGRMADLLGYLYMASAALRYYKKQGENAEDIPYLEWCLDFSLHTMQDAIVEIAHNFPQKGLRPFIIRRICFPFTLPYRKPRDTTVTDIALSMQNSIDLRARLTQYMYITGDKNTPTGRVENAYQLFLKARPLLKKQHMFVKSAVKAGQLEKNALWEEQIQAAEKQDVFTKEELELLKQYRLAYIDVLAVDAFPPSEANLCSK